MGISVALAAFNGEKFIKRQIESILPQLADCDEIVVSLDKSTDNTLAVLKSMRDCDARIKIIDGPGRGVVANFENAIFNCSNDYIFLSDQDDIWIESKVHDIVKTFLKSGADVVLHDAYVVDGNLNVIYDSFFKERNVHCGVFKNIIKNSYIGCCMAFKRDFIKKFIPFPVDIPMHDQWIGLMGEKYGKIVLIDKPLIKYVRHGENATSEQHCGIITMFKWRLKLIKNIIKY